MEEKMHESTMERVEALFGSGRLYCAETVLTLMAEAGGKDPKTVVPLATGFCSGMARTCGQCGAVSGAIMGIGLYAGRPEPGGDYDPAYVLTQDFLERFHAQYATINCFELIECDFTASEGQALFREGGKKQDCLHFVVFAVDTALGLLRENGYLPPLESFVKSRLAP
jgi:C_GCAxxG_C_C family probable redox protein